MLSCISPYALLRASKPKPQSAVASQYDLFSLAQTGSAFAQARMLEALEQELTEAEADIARRGRNSQAKHAAPKHADPADYAHATGLEALWGYLYLSGQQQRLDELMKTALMRTEDIWQKRTSR